MSKPQHVHCYSCGLPIPVEDGQELPVMGVYTPIATADGIRFTELPRPICGSCVELRDQAIAKAEEEAQAAAARSRLVVARGSLKPL